MRIPRLPRLRPSDILPGRRVSRPQRSVPMRIALGIVKLFPEGGLQRDCIRLAHILVARGHDVTLFTTEKTGPVNLPACAVVLLPVRAYTNHAIDLAFAKKFEIATANKFDRVVGFNKLFGLDFYYC